MKKKTLYLALMLALTAALPFGATAQTETEKFTDRLWYGGGFDFGIGGNTFFLGVSPMAAYKFLPFLSAGVRLPLDYTYAKFVNSAGQGANFSNLDVGVGTFARIKFLRNFFVHSEYNYIWGKAPVQVGNTFRLDPENPNKIEKTPYQTDEFNVGLGYTSGNRIGYEISLLYNVLESPSSLILPFQIRAGLNYNF